MAIINLLLFVKEHALRGEAPYGLEHSRSRSSKFYFCDNLQSYVTVEVNIRN